MSKHTVALPGKSSAKFQHATTNLANLLPTGTVLAFVALEPSFSNNGKCLAANKYLTFAIIVICSVFCFLSSFTDSFTCDHGMFYYGIATIKGLHIFNKDDCHDNHEDDDDDDDKENRSEASKHNQKRNSKKNGDQKANKCLDDLGHYRIHFRDIGHAFSSLLVFLVFATSNPNVQSCLFPHSGANGNQLMMNLPLGVGALATILFMIFPTKRRGIGYADSSTPGACPNCILNSRSSKSQHRMAITLDNLTSTLPAQK